MLSGDSVAEYAALPVESPEPELTVKDLPRPAGLQSYIGDIRRHALLTREEEHELALRYRAGDERAAERLLNSNLRLVVKIAHEYRRAHRHLDDLIQEGNLGLFMAVRKYDPDRGVKLSTYAAYWIRAYILKFILDNARLVRLGTTQAQRKLFFSLKKEQRKLIAEGIEASPATLAARLKVTEHEVVEMDQRLRHGDHSLDAPLRADDEAGATYLDLMAAPSDEQPDQVAEEHELRARLRRSMKRFRATLKRRDLEILRERIMSETPDTLQAIGDRYGISRERARQLESRLIERLNVHLKSEFAEPGKVLDLGAASLGLTGNENAEEAGDQPPAARLAGVHATDALSRPTVKRRRPAILTRAHVTGTGGGSTLAGALLPNALLPKAPPAPAKAAFPKAS